MPKTYVFYVPPSTFMVFMIFMPTVNHEATRILNLKKKLNAFKNQIKS